MGTDPASWVNFVSIVGVPAAMMFALLWYVVKRLDAHTAQLTEISETLACIATLLQQRGGGNG